MAQISDQITLGDIDPEYKAFVDKFNPKKTTDDCYTPPEIYDAVLAWAVKEYGIDQEKVVRPFWPGADYEKFDYPDDCVVLDNPPFSIVTKICRTYLAAGIKFFLFAPYLTSLQCAPEEVAHIITASSIEYENGAKVDTAFVTNLEDCAARTAPDLARIIKETGDRLRAKKAKQLPKYKFPDNIVTAAMLGYMAKYGVEFRVERPAYFIKRLDAMEAAGKKGGVFGGAYLLGNKAAAEKAAAEKAAAIRWKFSARELEIIERLEDETE